MKKVFLLGTVLFSALFVTAQPVAENIQIALAKNGANGSNAAVDASFEIALKAQAPYAAIPAAEDFIVYLRAPTSALAGTENVTITQLHPIFGTGTMLYQGKAEIGTFTYFFFALNAAAGLNLSLLPENVLTYAYTFKMTPEPAEATKALFKLVDQTNNAELTAANGGIPIFTNLMMQGANQLTATALSLLPIRLQDFNVTKQGNSNASISWTTSFEQHVSHFVVERSFTQNATQWTKVAQVAAVGNSSIPTSYSQTDINVYNGTAATAMVYYRIKVIDLDGAERFFPIRSLKFNGGSKGITLYPNPARDGFTISVPILNPGSKMVRFKLLNRLGQTVTSREVNAATASNYYYDLRTPGVISGEYLLQVIFDGELLETKKVIVQR